MCMVSRSRKLAVAMHHGCDTREPRSFFPWLTIKGRVLGSWLPVLASSDPLFLADLTTLQKYLQARPQVLTKVYFTTQELEMALQFSAAQVGPEGSAGARIRDSDCPGDLNRDAVPSRCCVKNSKKKINNQLIASLYSNILYIFCELPLVLHLRPSIEYIIQPCQVPGLNVFRLSREGFPPLRLCYG